MSINVDSSQWNLKTSFGIPYKLLEGYPRGTFSRRGEPSIEEQLILRVEDLFLFISENLASVISFPGGGWAYVYPRSCPGAPGVLAEEITFDPLDVGLPINLGLHDTTSPAGTYTDFVKVVVKYGAGRDEDSGSEAWETFLEISSEHTAEMMTAEGGGKATWQSTGEPVKELNALFSKIEPVIEWSVGFPNLPPAVSTYIIQYSNWYMGKVNSATMPAMRNATAGTVLFLGCSVRDTYQYDASGNKQLLNQLEMKLSQKQIYEDDILKGHNYKLNPDTGKYDVVLINGQPLFQSANLNLLWT